LLLFGILPMQAWILGLIVVGMDLLGALGIWRSSALGDDGRVAYEAHLAGAAFAYLYKQAGWNFGRLFSGSWPKSWRLRGPRLKTHHDEPQVDEADLHRRVDEILDKINREGASSLSAEEQRILHDASRRYQQRRR